MLYTILCYILQWWMDYWCGHKIGRSEVHVVIITLNYFVGTGEVNLPSLTRMKLPCKTFRSRDANKLHWSQLSHSNLTGITAHIICDVTQCIWLDAAGHEKHEHMSMQLWMCCGTGKIGSILWPLSSRSTPFCAIVKFA